MKHAVLLLVLGSVLAAPVAAQGAEGSGWWNGAPVRFHAVDGWAVVEGDIVLAPLAEIATSAPLDTRKSAARAASVLSGDRFRWPDGVIPYNIDAAVPNPNRIRDAISEWMSKTAIRLAERSGEANYVTFSRSTGDCTATVGMRGGQQFINVSDTCTAMGLAHEIGHALGFWHTQTRSDRDRYLRVLGLNINKSYRFAFDSHAGDADDLGPYDYASLMHYSPAAFAKPGLASMETIPAGIPIGQRVGLSTGDIAAATRLYGPPAGEVTITSNPPGLKVIVDGEILVTPRSFAWSEGTTHRLGIPEGFQSIDGQPNVRSRFAHWSDGGPEAHEIEIGAATRLFIANFVKQVRVRTEARGTGLARVLPEAPDGWYPTGTRVEVQAQPGTGFQFSRWFSGVGGVAVLASTGISSTSVPLIIDRDDYFYSARFVNTPLTTIASVPAGRSILADGQPCVTPCSQEWTAGTSHTIEAPAEQTGATANVRYVFLRWLHGGARSQQITAGTQSQTFTAEFEPRFRLTAEILSRVVQSAPDRPTNANLGLTPASPDGFYKAGETVQFSATQGTGWHFSNWTADLTGTEPVRSLVMNDEMRVTANFISAPFLTVWSVVHDASRQPLAVSPAQPVTVFCPDLRLEEEVEGQPDEGGRYPEELAGLRVTFGDTAAQLLRAGPGFIRLIAPATIRGQRNFMLALTVRGTRGTVTIPVSDFNAAIYSRDGSGSGDALAVNEDGAANSSANPGAQGAPITFLASGLGAPGESGALRLQPVVYLGGLAAQVISAAQAPGQPPGVIALSVRVPEGAKPGQASLEMNGQLLTSTVHLWVK